MDSEDIRYHAKEALAKAHLFENRAARYEFWVRLIDASPLAIPLLVGLIVMTYEMPEFARQFTINLAGTLLILQAFFDLFARTYKWKKIAKKALAASQDYDALHGRWDLLGRTATPIEAEVTKLLAEEEPLARRSVELNITPREARFGERYALHHYQIACPECHKVPEAALATKQNICPNCGK